jgi:arginyl-tRNA synthetase
MIEDRLIALVTEALTAAAGELGQSGDLPEVELSKPRQKEHGDFSTNVALVLAARVERQAREVAELIVRNLPQAPFVRSAEVAGPGFINFRLTTSWLTDALRDVAVRGEAYGRAESHGRRAQVEFVSANPTGPLHIGHARNAALGDALARVLEATGWTVEREYYFNDTGGQMDRFGASVEARYLQLIGREAEFPEDGYHGEYVIELARDILETEAPAWRPATRGRVARLQQEGGRSSNRSVVRSSDSGFASTATCTNACWRSVERSTRPSNAFAPPGTRTRRTGRSGSARPRSATTRTGRSCDPTAGTRTSAPMPRT